MPVSASVSEQVIRMVGATTGEQLQLWLEELRSSDSLIRVHAREALAAFGEPAVRPLIEMLHSLNEHDRQEAVRTLANFRHPDVATALVGALEDVDGDVRWLASNALIGLGGESVRPILRGLIRRSDSVLFRLGATRVVRALAALEGGELLEPVVSALENVEPLSEAPVAAYDALYAMGRSGIEPPL